MRGTRSLWKSRSGTSWACTKTLLLNFVVLQSAVASSNARLTSPSKCGTLCAMAEQARKRVVAMLRVSTLKQVKTREADYQRNQIRLTCSLQNLELVKEFPLENISGLHVRHTDQFKALKKGEFRVYSGSAAVFEGGVRQFRGCKTMNCIGAFSESRLPGTWTRWN